MTDRRPDASGVTVAGTPAAPPPASSRRQGWAHAALLAGFCAALYLPGLASLPLADPDESRAALVVQHMLRTGDWLAPRLAGEPYMDKPAPYFWLAAAGQLLTGDLELGGRLVSAVMGTLAVLVAWGLARGAGGPAAGLIAGAVLATGAAFTLVSHLYRMDMPFVAFMWLALAWFWRYERPEGPRPGDRWRRWVGFYAFCGAATLMKGPAGLVLPVLIVAAYLLLSGSWRRVLEVLHLPGIVAFLLIAAPWYLAVSLAVEGYACQFFVVQNLSRYAGRAMDNKTFPGAYYIGIILGGMMPWTVYLPGAIIRDFPRRWSLRVRKPLILLLWLAVVVPTVFFAMSRTKLAVYVMPVAPPLAVLIALPLSRWVSSRGPDRLYAAGVVAMAISVVVLAAVLIGAEYWEGWLDAWAALPAAGVALCATGMILSSRRGRREVFLAWAAAGACVILWFGAAHAAQRRTASRTLRDLGLAVRPLATGDALLCYYGKRPCSFALYAGCTVAPRFLDDNPRHLQDLAGLMQSDRRVLCLLRGQSALRTLEQAAGRPLPVVARQRDWAVVSNVRGP